MLQRAFIAAIFAAITYNAPASALTAKQKMETCKFGADDQKFKGVARKVFISKCMANERPSAKRTAPKPKK